MDRDLPRDAGRSLPDAAPGEFTPAPTGGYVRSEQETVAEAITRFYPYAVPRIVAVLIARTDATAHEAAEAAHVALIEAAQSWASIDRNPLSWCITVAKRHWGHRKYSAEESFDDIPPDSPLLRDVQQDVVRQFEARLRLTEAVQRLPLLTSRESHVLDLHLAGLTAAQIADHLGCAKATVRVHLANARRKLDGHQPDRHDGGAR